MTPKQSQKLTELYDSLTAARIKAKDTRGAAIGNSDLTNTMLEVDAFIVVLQRVLDDYCQRAKVPDLNTEGQ